MSRPVGSLLFLIADAVKWVDDTGGYVAGVATDSFQIAGVKRHGGCFRGGEVGFAGDNLIDDLLAVGRVFLLVLAHHGAGKILIAIRDNDTRCAYLGLNTQKIRILLTAALAGVAGACTPTVAVEAPKEPITINLNVKLDADVRLRVEEQAADDVETKPIF